MTLQRAFWALPLAVAVAVLAHLAVFGFGHAPGAGHAAELFAALCATLGAGLIGAFAGGMGGSKPPVATRARLGYSPLVIAAVAALAFGAIEYSEGHVAAVPWLLAIVTMLPLALAVAWLARTAGHAARSAGAALAAIFEHATRRAPGPLVLRRAPVRVRATSVSPGLRRGRAPPPPR